MLVVAKSGVLRGSYWTIGADPVVIGRSSACDIVFPDRTVSRRQCALSRDGDAVVLTDLSNGNRSLVNGAPVTRAMLQAGDEIAIGNSILLLSDQSPAELQPSDADQATRTVPISDGEFLDVLPNITGFHGDEARNVSDLYTLYLLAASLSEASTLTDGYLRTGRMLEKAFEGRTVALFRAGEDGALERTAGGAATPPELVSLAVKDRMAVLAPGSPGDGAHGFSMAAAFSVHGRVLGAVYIEESPEHAALDEHDLKFLAAVCRTAGPHLKLLADRESLLEENSFLRADYDASPRLIGTSSLMREVRATIVEVAQAELNVLLVGETGSGKELAARLLHQASPRANAPFVVVNCPAIPLELFESEVFGHEKGSFTGATEQRIGLFELADGGVLFLDEVGDLDLRNQARLLRSIETGTYRRVGGKAEMHADVRIVAATNRDLAEHIRQGAFREDLFHRLSGFELRVPSLHERRSDIPELARHFFDEGLRHVKKPLRGIRADAIAYLQAQEWPGNVRQLRNQMQRAMIRAKGDEVTVEDFRGKSVTPDPARAWDPISLAELERRHILETLEHCNGRAEDAAKLLGISPSTVYRRMREYDE